MAEATVGGLDAAELYVRSKRLVAVVKAAKLWAAARRSRDRKALRRAAAELAAAVDKLEDTPAPAGKRRGAP